MGGKTETLLPWHPCVHQPRVWQDQRDAQCLYKQDVTTLETKKNICQYCMQLKRQMTLTVSVFFYCAVVYVDKLIAEQFAIKQIGRRDNCGERHVHGINSGPIFMSRHSVSSMVTLVRAELCYYNVCEMVLRSKKISTILASTTSD